MAATSIGDSRYDDRLDETTSAGFRERQARASSRPSSNVRARIDPAGLSPAARITYDIFVSERELALEGRKYPEELMPLNQMSGLPMDLAVYGSGTGPQPFVTAKDYDRFLTRVRAVSALGRRRHRHDARRAWRAASRCRARPWPRWCRNCAKSSPATRRTTSSGRPSRRCRRRFRPRIASASATLTPPRSPRKCCPRTRGSRISSSVTIYRRRAPRLAGADLPDGQAWYRWRIRGATTMDMPADEIHRLGLAEVARIRGEMLTREEPGGLQGRSRRVLQVPRGRPAVLLHERRRAAGRLSRREAAHRCAAAEAVRGLSEGGLRNSRRSKQFRAASAAGASYQAPSPDGKRPGIFYINTHNLKAQPRFGLETLSLHEASPGHHFQISIQQELTDLPRFRRFNGYVSYSEGWALYAESIGKELGVFTDPYQWYGRLSDEMLRAMRLVVDTGLHSKGWTPRAGHPVHARQFVAGRERRHRRSGALHRVARPGAGLQVRPAAHQRVARPRAGAARARRSTCASFTARSCAMARCP